MGCGCNGGGLQTGGSQGTGGAGGGPLVSQPQTGGGSCSGSNLPIQTGGRTRRRKHTRRHRRSGTRKKYKRKLRKIHSRKRR
jgi:hypothetical protein